MNPILNNRYGCWVRDGIAYDNKLDAVSRQLSPSSDVTFYYHDHIWLSFNKSMLGKTSLDDLYKQRAQQLRAKYQYLILHFSGGSDSTNILYTFLNNNIKLDEVTVRWPKPLIDGKFYTPNTQDTSARNAASEWNYAIKPTLEYIASKHPNIKINVVDYGFDLKSSLLDTDNITQTFLHKKITRGLLAFLLSNNIEMQNKTTAHIFGIDKPIISIIKNTAYMEFVDNVLEHTMPFRNNTDDSCVELFYWSPDLPQLPFEQAYQTIRFILKNRTIMQNLKLSSVPTPYEINLQKQNMERMITQVIYKNTWNPNTFQAGKPNPLRSDWYFWLWEHPEYKQLIQNYKNAMVNLTTSIDPNQLFYSDGVAIMKPSHSKKIPVISF